MKFFPYFSIKNFFEDIYITDFKSYRVSIKNTDSPTLTDRWVNFSNKVVSEYFQIVVMRCGFGIEIGLREAYNVKFVNRNIS